MYLEALKVSMAGSVVETKAVEGSAEMTVLGTTASSAGVTEVVTEVKKIFFFFASMKKSLDAYLN